MKKQPLKSKLKVRSPRYKETINTTYRGGYLTKKIPIIAGLLYEHSGGFPVRLPPQVLFALNSLQKIPYVIDKWVLSIFKELIERDCGFKFFPKQISCDNERLPDELFSSLTKEEKMKLYDERKAQNTKFCSIASLRALFLRIVSNADCMKDEPCLYLPWHLDYRGRYYPLTKTISPVASQPARAVLKKAFGMPVTDDGYKWLLWALATEWGNGVDKERHEVRIKWAEDNLKELLQIIEDPVGTYEFWQQADSLRFLQVLKEIYEIRKNRHHSVCCDVFLDGTCNGLQHIAALVKDCRLAKSVNLLPEDRRYDIYSDVAEETNKWFKENNFDYYVTRKTVKRAVMTTPYGVTRYGILQQLIDEHLIPQGWHLKTVVQGLLNGINTAIGRGAEFLNWAREVARILSAHNMPLIWTSPSGMWVVQSNWKTIPKVIRCVEFSLVSPVENEPQVGGDVHVSKQINGFAPNLVHSCDAAHLTFVINQMYTENNVSRMVVPVHDQFGVHPNYVSHLRYVLLNEFTKMHSKNFLLDTANLMSYVSGVDVPSPPDPGDLDITLVREALYAFS